MMFQEQEEQGRERAEIECKVITLAPVKVDRTFSQQGFQGFGVRQVPGGLCAHLFEKGGDKWGDIELSSADLCREAKGEPVISVKARAAAAFGRDRKDRRLRVKAKRPFWRYVDLPAFLAQPRDGLKTEPQRRLRHPRARRAAGGVPVQEDEIARRPGDGEPGRVQHGCRQSAGLNQAGGTVRFPIAIPAERDHLVAFDKGRLGSPRANLLAVIDKAQSEPWQGRRGLPGALPAGALGKAEGEPGKSLAGLPGRAAYGVGAVQLHALKLFGERRAHHGGVGSAQRGAGFDKLPERGCDGLVERPDLSRLRVQPDGRLIEDMNLEGARAPVFKTQPLQPVRRKLPAQLHFRPVLRPVQHRFRCVVEEEAAGLAKPLQDTEHSLTARPQALGRRMIRIAQLPEPCLGQRAKQFEIYRPEELCRAGRAKVLTDVIAAHRLVEAGARRVRLAFIERHLQARVVGVQDIEEALPYPGGIIVRGRQNRWGRGALFQRPVQP